MELPLGMLVYSAHRQSDESALIMGLWYYKEMYVPTTIIEKKHSVDDLKSRRCLFIVVTGTFSQICDLLMQTDKFKKAGDFELKLFSELTDQLIVPSVKPIVFDDVYNIQGKSLALDTVCPVEESQDDILEQVNSPKKMIYVTISKEWSWSIDIIKSLS